MAFCQRLTRAVRRQIIGHAKQEATSPFLVQEWSAGGNLLPDNGRQPNGCQQPGCQSHVLLLLGSRAFLSSRIEGEFAHVPPAVSRTNLVCLLVPGRRRVVLGGGR